MPLTDVTVSINLTDYLGQAFDARRTRVYLTANAEKNIVTDKSTGEVRVGGGSVVLDAAGVATATVWAPGPDANPASWQTTFHIDYADAGTRQRKTVTAGPFTITASGTLAALIEEQAVPAEYLTTVTQQLDTKVTAAETARAGAEAARDAADALVLSDLGTSDGQMTAVANNPASQFSSALSASIGETAQTHVAVLAPWLRALRETPASAKIALVGDSTYDSAAAGSAFHAALKKLITPGAGLEGMADANVLNFGYNGQTTAQITSDAHMTDLGQAAPSLIIAGPGINDVRTRVLTDRATDVAWLRAILVTGFNKIRAACPSVPIIASVPNSFLTTDVGSAGYVTNGNPQECSAILRGAYLSLIDEWPDVLVDDTQEHVFGATSLATSPYMGDQIHPNATGFTAKVAHLKTLISYFTAPATARSEAARTASPYAPWTVYGREVEDTSKYALVVEADYQNQSATHIDIALRSGRRNNIARNDIIELPGGLSFQIPNTGGGFGNVANGAWTRLLFNAGIIPANTLVAGRGVVRIWRKRAGGDPLVEDVLRDTGWRYKKIGYVVAGGTTYVDVGATSITAERTKEIGSDWATSTVAGDLLYVEGIGAFPATVTAGQFSANGNNLRLTAGLNGQDFAPLVGRLAILVGNHA